MVNPRDIISVINTNELETFLSKTDSSFSLEKNIKEINVDYSWLEALEDSLGNIDKIVRNPRRFITQEEDVVIVEKAKKVSLETIKYLAEHSEDIRDIDEQGNIIPSKLLNVHKEDTIDLYENRFIYSLVQRLDAFINKQLKDLYVVSEREISSTATYKGETKFDNKKASIELKLNLEENIELNKNGKTLRERILYCYDIINGFKTTDMIKELIGCSLVKSPIRKTNLILREPNFQKAYLLWEQLDNFEFKDPKVIKYENIKDSNLETENEFTLAYYISCNALEDKKDKILGYKDLDSKLSKVIEEYIYEDECSLETITNKLKQFYIQKSNLKKEKEESIATIINAFISSHNDIIKDINQLTNLNIV